MSRIPKTLREALDRENPSPGGGLHATLARVASAALANLRTYEAANGLEHVLVIDPADALGAPEVLDRLDHRGSLTPADPRRVAEVLGDAGKSGKAEPCVPDFKSLSGALLLNQLGTDARKWAYAFLQIDPPTDEATLIGWFANAITVGFDDGKRAATAALTDPDPITFGPDRPPLYRQDEVAGVVPIDAASLDRMEAEAMLGDVESVEIRETTVRVEMPAPEPADGHYPPVAPGGFPKATRMPEVGPS